MILARFPCERVAVILCGMLIRRYNGPWVLACIRLTVGAG